jgi:prepilin-type N-terminal cleavage/methylation domain-containing protein
MIPSAKDCLSSPRPSPRLRGAARHAGYSLLELLVALTIILVVAAVALSNIGGAREEAALLGAARSFKDEFMKARSVALRSNAQTAIRFETDTKGNAVYSTYVDGNWNGVLSADIASGVDRRVAGPIRLDAGVPEVRVAVIPGAPSPAPDSGFLSAEPIRFGTSRMVSFSTIGTGTPGTFYLSSRSAMAGVRVTGGSARIRIMLWRGKRWFDRQG